MSEPARDGQGLHLCCAPCAAEASAFAHVRHGNACQVDHIKQPENWALVESAKVIYNAGFFITVRCRFWGHPAA